MLIRRDREYHTNFGRTESPISEGGRWINGLTLGANWTDIQTGSGRSYGTMTVHAHPPYDDSSAYWVPDNGQMWRDMEVEAQVYKVPSGWTGNHEVELLLCGQLRNGVNQCYECLFSVNDGPTYTEFVRWNGAVSDFTSLSGATFNLTIANGDWIKATKIGTTITMYHRSVAGGDYTQKQQWTDTVLTEGYAGIGHWLNGAGSNSDFGLTSWRARQLL